MKGIRLLGVLLTTLFIRVQAMSQNNIDSVIINTIDSIEHTIVRMGPVCLKKDESKAYKDHDLKEFVLLEGMRMHLVTDIVHGFIGSGKDYRTNTWKRIAPQVALTIIKPNGKIKRKVMKVHSFLMKYIAEHKLSIAEANITLFTLYPIYQNQDNTQGMMIHYWPKVSEIREYKKQGRQIFYQEKDIKSFSFECLKQSLVSEIEQYGMSFILGDIKLTIILDK